MYVAVLQDVQFVKDTQAVHPVGQLTHFIFVESGNVPTGQFDAKTQVPLK